MQTRIKQLEAILSLCVTVLVIYFLFWKSDWLLYGVIFILIFSLLFKTLSGKLAAGWLAITHAMGRFYSAIILGIIFYLIITPIAFFFRQFNPTNQPDKTNLQERDHIFGTSDFDNIF